VRAADRQKRARRLAETCGRGLVVALCLAGSGPSAAPAAHELSEAAPRALPDRGRTGAPPVIPAARYAVDPRELIPNPTFVEGLEGWTGSAGTSNALIANASRPGRSSLQVNANTVRKLPTETFLPGRSYTLSVVAGATAPGAFIAVVFREPKKQNSVRTERLAIPLGPAGEARLDFTTPPFAGLSELSLGVGHGRLLVHSISAKMRAALPVTEPVQDWSRSYAPQGYGLVFNDEFNGDSLNRGKWFTRYIFGSETGDQLDGERQAYADHDNHVEKDGVLNLVARRLPGEHPGGRDYESGMIRSDWTFRYGYVEARVKMPRGLGVWPAFWLNSDVAESGRMNWPPEIDVFEFVNNGKDDKVDKIHIGASTAPGLRNDYVYTAPGFIVAHHDYHPGFNFSDDWHTIGALWTPDRLAVYVDGVKACEKSFHWVYKAGALGAPAHILLNLAIGGAWAGRYGIEDAAFPQALAVDWVRVFQKATSS